MVLLQAKKSVGQSTPAASLQLSKCVPGMTIFKPNPLPVPSFGIFATSASNIVKNIINTGWVLASAAFQSDLSMESSCRLHRVLLWRKDCSPIMVWASFKLRIRFTHAKVKHIRQLSTSSSIQLSVSQSLLPIDLWILRNRTTRPITLLMNLYGEHVSRVIWCTMILYES